MAVIKFNGKERGCGYPQEGGMYLLTSPVGAPCDRMPYEIPVCPVCGETIRFTRSMQQINAKKLFGEHEGCTDPKALRPCPACQPGDDPAGLMWVGDSFYSPGEFVGEAAEMGVSKRISKLPEFFEVGKTWLFLAHKKALKRIEDGKTRNVPGVIMACRPTKLVKVMKEKDITDEKVKELEEKGIDVMSVPDEERFTTPKKPKGSSTGLDALLG